MVHMRPTRRQSQVTTRKRTDVPDRERSSRRVPHLSRLGDRTSLFAWFRILPVLVVIISCAVLYLYSRGPAVIRATQYPLEYTDYIASSSARYDINPYLVCAVIKGESNWEPDAVSHAGAIGLMQLMPTTAQTLAERGVVDGNRYPPDDLTNPQVNIEYGTAFLRYLVDEYHELEPVIAAYNAGMGNVNKWLEEEGELKDNIAFDETRAYLVKIMRNKEEYEELYPNVFGSLGNR